MAPHVRRLSTADGFARSELPAAAAWHAGLTTPPPREAADDDARWLPGGSGHAAMADWRQDGAVTAAVRAALVQAR